MTIDKRISYNRGSIPDRNRGQIRSRNKPSAPKKSSPFSGNESRQQYSAKQTATGAVKGGGIRGPDNKFTTSFVSGDRGRDSRDEFIRNVQKTNPGFTGGPNNKRTAKQFVSGIFNAIPGYNFLRNFNSPAMRMRLTGYPTQAAYEQARQNRINLNRINTIQNTLDRKYPDGDYSDTDLDERLAGLKSLMGITENTEADLRPDLDFSNQAEGVPDFVPQNNVTQNGILSILSNLSGNIDKLSKFPNINDLFKVDRNIILNQEMAKSFTPDQINKMMNPPGQMDDTGINFYNDDAVPLDPNLNFFKVNDLRADALNFPTDDGSGISLMNRSILRNAGYNDSQIREAQEDGYLDQLIRDIEGPIGGSMIKYG
jgi:hypothetical protein